MRGHHDEEPFSDFILKWWEEGDRLHEDPVLAAAAMGEVAKPESSPIWLLAVWASLASLLVLGAIGR